jgi:hypothetical protein
MLWGIVFIGIAFLTSSCGRNVSEGTTKINPPLNQDAGVSKKDSVATKKDNNKKVTKKSSTKKSKKIGKKAEEEVAASANERKSTNGRTGLIGAYMDFVDNSPLNPMNMKGAGALPPPVTKAMEMQGMKKQE